MDSKRKVREVFNDNPQGSRLRGRPKNRRSNCVQTGISKCKITNWKERSKTELTGRRKRKSALDCSAIKEEEEEEEEDSGGGDDDDDDFVTSVFL